MRKPALMNVSPKASRGFTLLEVMVSVLVVAVGLLGLAKMQALAVSSSQVSGSRAMVALQAGSLAATMHGAKDFWGAAGAAPASFTITGTTISDSKLATAADCVKAKCATAASLAAYDVQTWAALMTAQFASHKTTVACAGTPVSCTISIDWTEKTVTSVNQLANAADATKTQTYVLYVEP